MLRRLSAEDGIFSNFQENQHCANSNKNKSRTEISRETTTSRNRYPWGKSMMKNKKPSLLRSFCHHLSSFALTYKISNISDQANEQRSRSRRVGLVIFRLHHFDGLNVILLSIAFTTTTRSCSLCKFKTWMLYQNSSRTFCISGSEIQAWVPSSQVISTTATIVEAAVVDDRTMVDRMRFNEESTQFKWHR